MQVQERLTDQIKLYSRGLNPLGVVVIEAQHMCMQIQKQNSVTTTLFTGAFEEEQEESLLA
jgi:GTP cyclohydrolase I